MAVSLAPREIYVMTTKLYPFWLKVFSKYTTYRFVAMGDGDNGRGMVRRYCAEQLAKVNEEELKRNLESGDKEKIEKAVQETLAWLDLNHEAEATEFQAKRDELRRVVGPMLMKGYRNIFEERRSRRLAKKCRASIPESSRGSM